MEDKKEEKGFKEGLKVDFHSQKMQMQNYLIQSIDEHSRIMENKDLCKNFIAAFALEAQRLFPDLNLGYRFRFKSPKSSKEKLKEVVFAKNAQNEMDVNFKTDENGNLVFDKGLFDTCAVRVILSNVPSMESLENNVYITDEQKESLKESYELYVDYMKKIFGLKIRQIELWDTMDERKYYDLHIDIYKLLAQIEQDLREKLNMGNEMTGEEEKYRNKARNLEIDIEDGKILTEVSEEELGKISKDMVLLNRKLPDMLQQDILNVAFPIIMEKSDLLSKDFHATISDDSARTKQKMKRNGYISVFNGINILDEDNTKNIKMECQLQTQYRYIKHKQTHFEMDGKMLTLLDTPDSSDPDFERKVREYKEYIDQILYEGYELHFSVDTPEEVEILPYTKEETLENLYIPYKDSKNPTVKNKFKQKVKELKELGILEEENKENESYSVISIKEFLKEREEKSRREKEENML